MKHATNEDTKRPRSAGHFDSDLEKGYGTFPQNEGSPRWTTEDDQDDPKDSLGSSWMSRLDDSIPLSALTIPGTHDSAAYTSIFPFVSTQTLSIPDQLALGIRYFDLRIGLRNDVPEMVHGVAFLGVTLPSVLHHMVTFLRAHPSEALIIQIKQDRRPERSTIHFSQAIFLALDPHRPFLRTANTTPTLGEARGKIQLFRRYTGPGGLSAYGIDVTQWQDNPSTPFTISNPRIDQYLTIQDHYSFSSPLPLPSLIDAKGADVARLLDLAGGDPDPEHWYLNFTSALEVNVWFQIPPRSIAVGGYHLLRWVDGVNPRLRAWLEERGAGRRLGVVVMDFPEQGGGELVEMLILSNYGKDGPGDGEEEEGMGGKMWWWVWAWWVVMVVLVLLTTGLALVAWVVHPEDMHAAVES